MKKTARHMLTTHVGSLPRPKDLLDLMKGRASGQGIDEQVYQERVRRAVLDIVKQQKDAGIDIVSDGEQSKIGFFSYVSERLEGFEPTPGRKLRLFTAEMRAFPEYYEQYFREAMLGGMIMPLVPLVCKGPVKYARLEPLQRDIANLKAAMA